MNRKDMIVIAVLSNVILSLVVFLSADKPDRTNPARAEAIVQSCEKKEILASAVPLPALKPEKSPPVAVEKSLPVKEQPATPSLLPALPTLEPVPVAIKKEPLKAQPKNAEKVVVRAGDKLEKIAKAHQCPVEKIVEMNDLKDDKLHIGQALWIPIPSPKSQNEKQTPATASAEVSGAAESDAVYYIVKSGDSPWTIAMKNHIKVEDLLKLNNLDGEKAKKIRAGDRLRIR